jgi:segregation and condensation protein A
MSDAVTVVEPDKGFFSFKNEVFEGPLELLIDLVEKRKLLINDISLADVTDEYMARVSHMQERSLPHTAQFVALAATLLLIKSKSLLPVLELTTEEETAIDDLEERLKRYALYRAAAKTVQDTFGKTRLYAPEFTPPPAPVFHPDAHCTTAALREAMGRVISNLPKTEVKPKAQVKPTISLEEMMQRLTHRIESQLKTTFFELQKNEPERKTVIVGFLAILELCKQGNLLITQPQQFADIEIELERSGTPRYY